LATPLLSQALVYGLNARYRPIRSAIDAPGADTVIVLSTGVQRYHANNQEVIAPSGETAHNALEVARLYRVLNGPRVIASGGIVDVGLGQAPESELLRRTLVALGVPNDRIVLETHSRTTRENVVNVMEMLGPQPRPCVLVTTPQHMGRALEVFSAQGLKAIPSVSAYQTARWRPFPASLLPALDALQSSTWAVYEYLARAYYRLRGW
jgi:uncharacterized SAM-binding protein YcdF (DUF218 family)